MLNRHNSNYSNNISIVNSNLRLVMPLLNPNERCLNVRISIISMTASFRSTSFSSRSFFIVLIVFVFLWYLQFDLLNVIFFYKKNTVGFDPIRIGADSYFIGYGILNTDYYLFELQMHGTSSLLPIR